MSRLFMGHRVRCRPGNLCCNQRGAATTPSRDEFYEVASFAGAVVGERPPPKPGQRANDAADDHLREHVVADDRTISATCGSWTVCGGASHTGDHRTDQAPLERVAAQAAQTTHKIHRGAGEALIILDERSTTGAEKPFDLGLQLDIGAGHTHLDALLEFLASNQHGFDEGHGLLTMLVHKPSRAHDETRLLSACAEHAHQAGTHQPHGKQRFPRVQ
mmetsp:Transcript_2105/g.4498  ORF Transcript_2105/g.4498 Transcript_2105/m.4498 type:complete len:217 (+) Transcript_2105:101-751(+)